MNTAFHHYNSALGSFENRRLQKALTHVNNYWFPANPDLLQKIRNGLQEGRYDLGLDFLLQDLKRDYALYMYCLKELGRLLDQEGVPFKLDNPLDFLEQAGFERIKRVLTVDARHISRHDAAAPTLFQARQFQASFISAATAEVLCEKTDLEPNSAHLTALLRQLGLTLIAWNYPMVYQRALAALNGENSLDALISEKLGFSPLLLAITVAQRWRLTPELEQAMADGQVKEAPEAVKEQEKIKETAAQLARLCRVGEALARANQPDVYPSASADWNDIRLEIEHTLGREGLKAIEERVNEYCAEYRARHPELFQHNAKINPELHLHVFSEKALFKNNCYIDQCPPLLKKRFKEFYAGNPSASSLREALAKLMKDIFPLTEFSGGCVYTLDTGAASLIPRLRIGTLGLHTCSPLPLQNQKDDNHPVWTGLQCSIPITGHVAAGGLSYIVGRLGPANGPPVGVLYVELPSRLLIDPASTHLVHFKALRQTFQDLLGLK